MIFSKWRLGNVLFLFESAMTRWIYRTLYGLTLPHRLNVETALLPVKAEPAQSTLAGFRAHMRANDHNRPCSSEIHQAVESFSMLFVLLSEPAQST